MSYKTFEETKIAQFSKREMFIQFVNQNAVIFATT